MESLQTGNQFSTVPSCLAIMIRQPTGIVSLRSHHYQLAQQGLSDRTSNLRLEMPPRRNLCYPRVNNRKLRRCHMLQFFEQISPSLFVRHAHLTPQQYTTVGKRSAFKPRERLEVTQQIACSDINGGRLVGRTLGALTAFETLAKMQNPTLSGQTSFHPWLPMPRRARAFQPCGALSQLRQAFMALRTAGGKPSDNHNHLSHSSIDKSHFNLSPKGRTSRTFVRELNQLKSRHAAWPSSSCQCELMIGLLGSLSSLPIFVSPFIGKEVLGLFVGSCLLAPQDCFPAAGKGIASTT